MSGSIGANRIPREAVEPTVKKYIENILKKYPPFRNAKISGSYNTVVKPDHGDLDLIVHVDAGENDKKTLKKKFAEYLNSLPDDVIVPFKAGRHQGKKTAGTGDIVITQIPIEGYPDLTVQVDNMIVTSEREGDYRKSFLDVPGEKQALLIGLVKTVLMEEDPKKVFARLGIKDLPSLDDNQEFEFNLSSKGLTLRLVTLGDDFKELGRNEIWSSYNWDDVVKLLVKYDLSLPFGDLLKQIKAKLANPRSKNRVKGLFKSMLVIGAGEKGTSKGDNKEAALNAVNALLENKLCKGLVESLILPFLIENIGETQFNFPPNETIALYPGKFKPPHKGHLDVVNQLTRIADQVYVLISPKPHEGITAEQSLDIWEKLYSPLISDRRKVKFVISQLTPVKDVYDIITDNPDTNFIAAYGKEDAGRYSKLNSDRVKTYDAGNVEGISATNLRAALNSQGDITPFIPEEVSPIRYLETLGVLLHETLKEYKNQNTLNPVVFNGLEIKPKVKEVLLKIADEFWNSLELDVDYDDVLLLGSSANYNWTPYSDVDLHILVDFDEFEDPKIAKKYFDSAKSRFNDAHNLKIKNNDIEVYVQNSKEPNASVGVYSLLNDKWLQKPQYGKMEIPDKEIENKAKPFKSKIDKILRTKPTPNNYDFLTDSIKGLQDKLKKFRQIGLETGGEYSIENLAFKNLRNTGYIEKLLNYKTEIMDKVLSIKEVFDRPVDSYPFNEPGEGTYLFISDSGNKYVVYIDEVNENRIVIDFGISDETGDIDYPETNVGELYKVMSTIIAIAKDYISKHPEIEIISWSSVAKRGQKKIGDTQRDKLYKLILKKQGGLSDKDIKLINGEWWAYLKGYDPMFEDLSPESDDELLSPDDLSALDQYADSALNPIDVDLDPKSDRHFLDRAIERGVTKGELKDFFARLGLKKDNLKYLFTKAKEKGDKDIVVTDKKTNINIPFEDTTSSAKDRMANRIKSIGAKTIHKKPNFHTPNVRLTFAENIQNSQTPEQVRDFQTLLLSLTNHLQDNLSITPLPKIKFINDDIDNANNILGRTAYYNPTEKSITLYTYGRHPKDVLRSYSHEMIHHKQNLEGRLERKIYTTNINEDDNLLELEREAYELGNLLFRSWENGLDNKND
jgi:cytidyltransferase-like protein